MTSSNIPSLRAPAAWQALSFLFDPEGFFTKAYQRYGDIFTVDMLGSKWVILAHPDLVAQTFSYDQRQLSSGEALRVLRPIIGTRNLLLLDGQEHLDRRRMQLPAFHGNHMHSNESAIRQATHEELLTWSTGIPFPALPRMESLTLRTMMSFIFGPEHKDRLRALADNLLRMLRWITNTRRLLVLFLAGPDRLMNLPEFRRQIHVIDRDIIAEINYRRSTNGLRQCNDVLSLLMRAEDDDDKGLSVVELRDELLTLLVAGHKNTATMLAWALHELARNPTVQARCVREPATLVDAVIAETLRIRPPVPLIARRLQAPLEIAGLKLPTGTNLGPCTLLVHRRADIYPEPLAFKPDRFLAPPAHEWFPFGGGINRCIGASFARFEARIILDEILRTMNIAPAHPRPEQAKPQAIVLVPAHGAQIIVTRT